jgi:hypothetical protein
MEAGFGAEEQATRRARRVERLRQEQAANDSADGAVAEALARAEREKRNWAAGAEGERRVAETLDTLSQYGWTALHDVHWPGRPLANLDHVAIGPGGVLIIDAKNWTGSVTLTEGVLRQNGYRRDRELGAVADATAAVTALVAPEHRSAVAGMICLASQDQPATWTEPGVRVVGRLQLASHLVGLPAKLSPYDVADLGRFLGSQLGAGTSPSLLTTAALSDPPPKRPSRSARSVSLGIVTYAPAGLVRRQTRSGRRRPTRPAQPRVGRAPTPAVQAGRSCLTTLIRLGIVLIVFALFAANAARIGAWVSGAITSSLTSVPTQAVVVPLPPG